MGPFPRSAAVAAVCASLVAVTAHAAPTPHPCLTPGPGDACRGADLRGADLRGHDLRYADLRGARLSGARLTAARLDRARLRGAVIHGAAMRGASLRGADLRRARIGILHKTTRATRSANAIDPCATSCAFTDLSGADLSGATLSGTHMQSVDLGRANLSGANLGGARISSSDFTSADLSGSNIGGARIFLSDFTSADLSAAVIAGTGLFTSNLTDASLRGATTVGPVSTGGVPQILVGVAIDGSTVTRTDFTGANLTDLSTSRTDMAPAILTGAFEQPTWVLRGAVDYGGVTGLSWPSISCALPPRPYGSAPVDIATLDPTCATPLPGGGSVTFGVGTGRPAATVSVNALPPGAVVGPGQSRPTTSVVISVPWGIGTFLFGTGS